MRKGEYIDLCFVLRILIDECNRQDPRGKPSCCCCQSMTIHQITNETVRLSLLLSTRSIRFNPSVICGIKQVY